MIRTIRRKKINQIHYGLVTQKQTRHKTLGAENPLKNHIRVLGYVNAKEENSYEKCF